MVLMSIGMGMALGRCVGSWAWNEQVHTGVLSGVQPSTLIMFAEGECVSPQLRRKGGKKVG